MATSATPERASQFADRNQDCALLSVLLVFICYHRALRSYGYLPRPVNYMSAKVQVTTSVPPTLQRGFTLIEIMVVVIIIGLLAAVVVPQFLGRVDDARIAKAKQDIQAIETALPMFKVDNYVYPTTDLGLQALVQKPDSTLIKNWRLGGYLQHLNK